MALGALKLVGRSGVLRGAAREQMLSFIRWIHVRVPLDSRIQYALTDRVFTIYVGHYYERADGYTYGHSIRNERRRAEKAPFHISIHVDRRALCNPHALAEVLVHEIRHAADFEWQELLDRGTDAFRDYHGHRKGMRRGLTDREAIGRRAEARATRAVETFRRDVRDREVIAAFDRIFSPEVRMQMCPPNVAFRAAMRRVGR